MSESGCGRWADLCDRAALGERLSDEERRFEHRHLSECAACAAEARVWDALGGMLEEDASLPPRVLEGAGRPGPPRRVRRISRALSVAAIAVIAAAAAAVVVLWLGPSSRTHVDGALSRVSPAEEVHVSVASVSRAATVEGVQAVSGMAVRPGQRVEVQEGRLCLVYSRGVTACAAAGSTLRPANGARSLRLVLEKGAVVCRVDAPLVGTEFSVETPRGRVTAKGTMFAVELHETTAFAVRLHRGTVEVESPSGARRTLRAPAAVVVDGAFRDAPSIGEGWEGDLRLLESGEPPARTDASPRDVQSAELGASEGMRKAPSKPGSEQRVIVSPEADPRTARLSASDLLARAGRLRASRRFGEAGAAYEALLREYPGSVAARAALVSLAELQLSRLGQPARALRSFETYLSQGGPLRQEARYGRIRALRRLGRAADARAATELFLRDYPGSPQAEALRGAPPERSAPAAVP